MRFSVYLRKDKNCMYTFDVQDEYEGLALVVALHPHHVILEVHYLPLNIYHKDLCSLSEKEDHY